MIIPSKKITRILTTSLSFAVFIFLVCITWVSAEPKVYQPLVGIPGITDQSTTSLADYLNALYLFTISVGGLIGVVKIGFAGVKYSMSDVVTDKSEARKDIMGVLLGLAILLIPFIVLNTIYPGLTNLDVLKTAPKATLTPSAAPPGSGGTQPFNAYLCTESRREVSCSQFELEMGTCTQDSGGYTQDCPTSCRSSGGTQCVTIQGAAGSPPTCRCTK